MSAEIGNEYWKLRDEDGRKKIWSSPDELWNECVKYFEATKKRKWYKIDFRGKDNKKVKIPTQTPLTLKGLCLFLDCDKQTFDNYSNKTEYKDFFGVTTRVRDIIYVQKYEGAVVGAFNPNIIARDLGLIDKSESTNKNYNMNSPELSAKEMKEYNKSLEEGY